MTDPEPSNVYVFKEAVAREKRMPTPKLVALPETDEDNAWRDILADFERRFQQARDEESER